MNAPRKKVMKDKETAGIMGYGKITITESVVLIEEFNYDAIGIKENAVLHFQKEALEWAIKRLKKSLKEISLKGEE